MKRKYIFLIGLTLVLIFSCYNYLPFDVLLYDEKTIYEATKSFHNASSEDKNELTHKIKRGMKEIEVFRILGHPNCVVRKFSFKGYCYDEPPVRKFSFKDCYDEPPFAMFEVITRWGFVTEVQGGAE